MQPIDEQLTVATPELVEFGYEVAGVGSRFIAALVDTAIIGAIYLLIQIAGIATSYGGQNLIPDGSTGVNYFILGLLTILGFVVLWGYYVFFETLWNGQTPGKRLSHLRVVREDSSPIGFWEALIRNLVRIVDFLPLGYALGVIVMFVNGRARRLGDFAAGTLVVREGNEVSLAQLLDRTTVAIPGAAWGGPAGPAAGELDVRRLRPSDLVLVREVLARQALLTPGAAWQLSLKATQVVAAQTGYRGPVVDPRAFLAGVLRLAESRTPADALPPAPPVPAGSGEDAAP